MEEGSGSESDESVHDESPMINSSLMYLHGEVSEDEKLETVTYPVRTMSR